MSMRCICHSERSEESQDLGRNAQTLRFAQGDIGMVLPKCLTCFVRVCKHRVHLSWVHRAFIATGITMLSPYRANQYGDDGSVRQQLSARTLHQQHPGPCVGLRSGDVVATEDR